MILAPEAQVMVSYGATQTAKQSAQLCQPAMFHPMSSIAYRLARVAAGDGVAAVSLYSVSPHDLVAATLCCGRSMAISGMRKVSLCDMARHKRSLKAWPVASVVRRCRAWIYLVGLGLR